MLSNIELTRELTQQYNGLIANSRASAEIEAVNYDEAWDLLALCDVRSVPDG